jgi:hypothetical protein
MNEVIFNPTKEDIEDAGRWFDFEFSYCEGAMTELFQAFPRNENVHQVYMKAVALNALYSTQIPLYNPEVPSLWEVADHIVSGKIDDLLDSGSPEAVSKVAAIDVEGKHHRFNYSFATKYCSWHRPDVYPIFDSRVNEYLWHLKKLGTIPIAKRNDLWDYPEFKKIVNEFRERFGLEGFSYKVTDKFLYREGGKLLASASSTAQSEDQSESHA